MTITAAQHWLESILGFAGSAWLLVRLMGAVWERAGKVRRVGPRSSLQGGPAKHDWGGFWP